MNVRYAKIKALSFTGFTKIQNGIGMNDHISGFQPVRFLKRTTFQGVYAVPNRLGNGTIVTRNGVAV